MRPASLATHDRWVKAEAPAAGLRALARVRALDFRPTSLNREATQGGVPVIYELRTYEAAPGKLAALNARFREHTTPLFARHNMQVVGFWTYAHGGWSDRLVYMMAFDDMADRDRKWAAFGADPDWIKARDESQRDGTLTVRIRSDLLRPTDYSPAQ